MTTSLTSTLIGSISSTSLNLTPPTSQPVLTSQGPPFSQPVSSTSVTTVTVSSTPQSVSMDTTPPISVPPQPESDYTKDASDLPRDYPTYERIRSRAEAFPEQGQPDLIKEFDKSVPLQRTNGSAFIRSDNPVLQRLPSCGIIWIITIG